MDSARIRVLVAEDSLTMRKMLVEVLGADPGIEVIGEAEDGAQAIDLCYRLRPDVVTLDMMMPNRTGLEATEHIMAHFPTPILIVSASVNRAELFKTYQALAAGAVDVIEKPLSTELNEDWSRRLLSAVKIVSHIKVITHVRGKLVQAAQGHVGAVPEKKRSPENPWRCVAIGVSTGGPNALVEILKNIPESFPLPILIAIHISSAFGSAFAEWLNSQSLLPVAYARDGEALPRPGEGRVILAPPDKHLVVQESRLRLTSSQERHSCRPSVDVLFESLAQELKNSVIGCLLTGMGRDGAQGLLAIRRAGGLTIAQDEATSVIFGMPREAIQIGAAQRVLPLPQIAPTLLELST